MKRLYTTCALVALMAATVAAEAAGPTDPQIAAIVVTANQVDIDAGNFAKSRAQSGKVREFAQLMVTDHSAVNKSATELVRKLKVTPEPNATSKALKEGGEENIASLSKLSGAELDAAYVAHEVTYHETVLDALDKTLIPGATNAELKALLVKVRPAFVAHLEHARALKAEVGKTP
jgi:putative membrane protein